MLRGARLFCLGRKSLELFLLTDIGGVGDDLSSVSFLEPLNDY